MSTFLRRKTILIVDDDVSITRYLANKVHSETVLTSIIATTLSDACSIIEDQNFDIDAILTDLYFEEGSRYHRSQLIDGLDLLDLTHRKRPNVKLYVFSIWMENDNYRHRAEELGIPVVSWFHKMFYPPGSNDNVPWRLIERDLLENEPGDRSLPSDDDAYIFDVFLAHNSKEKDQVRDIANELKRWGLKPWLDEWHVPPGRPFQDAIEDALPASRSIAVFIGSEGFGPWQSLERRVAISQFVERKAPVIPVILKSTDEEPSLPPFLSEFNSVTFAPNIFWEESIRKLVWGITQVEPLNEKP